MEFMYYIKKDSSAAFVERCKLDTTVYRFFPVSAHTLCYNTYPGYRYYPVVGISKEQAELYCIWRSNVVNQLWIEKGLNARVTFRLPTIEEWEYAATGSLDKEEYPFGYKEEAMRQTPRVVTEWKKNHVSYWDYLVTLDSSLSRKTIKHRYLEYAKTKEVKLTVQKNFPDFVLNKYRFTSNIHDSPPNSMGLYHMIGNVAEMVQEEGIVKGGSWVHPLEICKIENDIRTENEVTAWIGFRCIAEIEIQEE